MTWLAQAPSNIALIKYMGKTEGDQNIPANPSLSYTLNHLLSNVSLTCHSGKQDLWEPLELPGNKPLMLSKNAIERFLNHLKRLKLHFHYNGYFIVRSTNNFPQSSGLASSASSFAALTKCAVRTLSELTQTEEPPQAVQAQLSRLGSGSSCRSFFAPWALWDGTSVTPINLPYSQLLHQVILITQEEKSVSSSLAHQRIQTSPLYKTRPQRAQKHLKLLLTALEMQDWESAYHIAWTEFQDMHQLFSTCAEPFSYMTPATISVLNFLKKFWETHQDGPIITLDAGSNIHLLYREDQKNLSLQIKHHFLGQYDFL